jgi:hypothetical protein
LKPFKKYELLYLKHIKMFALCFILFFGATHIEAQSNWVQQLGGTEGDSGNSSSADALGNVYTVGTFSGTSNFGTFNLTSTGKGDIFVAKTNANDGSVIWAVSFGAENEDVGNAIVTDPSGNIYFTGRFSNTITFGTHTLISNGNSESFIVKLDPTNGSVIWAKKIGGTGNDGGLSITSDAQGNIYTCGYFQGIAVFGTFTLNTIGTNYNIFITRTNGTGNFAWAKAYGNNGFSFGTSLTCDVSGDVYMTGYYEGNVAFGAYNVSSVNYQDIFVTKHIASTGNVSWATTFGGSGNDNGTGIVAKNGFIYTTGKFEDACSFGTSTLTSEGSADVFISKQDALTGAVVWTERYGAAGFEQSNAIALDNNDNLFITGQFSGFVNFGNELLISNGVSDAFLVKIQSSTKEVKWAIGMGGNNVDCGYGITLGVGDAIYCTGFFQVNSDIAGYDITSKGSSDVFVLKLNSATVGVKENLSFFNSIKIMPIPFKDELTIFINNFPSTPYQLTLSDLTGKILFQMNSTKSELDLNLETLNSGVYFVAITNSIGTSIVKKIIKE